MSHRFRFIGAHADGGNWCISGDEFTHLRRILRLGPGDRVEVTDAAGSWAEGEITGMAGQVAVIATEDTFKDPPPVFRIALAVGALKPSAVDELLPSIVELGIDEFHIFGQDEVAKFRISDKAMLRWAKITRGAIKQCRRSWLPEVHTYKNADALIHATRDRFAKKLLFTAGATATISGDVPAQAGDRDSLAILGGEKGLSPRELQILTAAGFEPRTLGPHILRAITAAIAGATMLADYRLRTP